MYRGVKGAGTYTIHGDILTCKYTTYDQGDSYKWAEDVYRIAGVAVFPGGEKVLMLMEDLKLPVNNVSVGHGGKWHSTKKRARSWT